MTHHHEIPHTLARETKHLRLHAGRNAKTRKHRHERRKTRSLIRLADWSDHGE